MQPIVWPYKLGSVSAKALATALDTRRVRTTNSRYRPRENHLIINWGCNQFSEWFPEYDTQHPLNLLNSPGLVSAASDKIRCLQLLQEAGVNVPQFSTSLAEVRTWFDEGIEKVFCRTLTRANSGRGIVLAEEPDQLVPAPLFTAGVGKRREYRVHVMRGEVIDFVQKKKMSDETISERDIQFDTDIRSHQNGWVFAREGVELLDDVRDQSVRAIEALGLDFGAVDVAKIAGGGPAVVFEVNTAPGLEGTTLERYVAAFNRLVNGYG